MQNHENDNQNNIKPWSVLLVVGTGNLLSAMAGSTITIALPSISNDINISLHHTSWIMLTFLLTVTVLLLVAGRAGDIFGHKTIYLYGFFLFGASSLICGLTSGFQLMIAGRIFQGIGGAMTMATGPALLTTSFPGKQRGKALGILATTTYTGLTIGPMIGGLLISIFGWQWIFFMNVPIAIIVVILGLYFLPTVKKKSDTYFDFKGMVSLIIGLSFLLLALSEGKNWGWLSLPVLLSGVFGLICMIAFIKIEIKQSQPLLDLKLFSSKVFSGSVLSAIFNYVAIFHLIILMPFYLIEALKYAPAQAGIILSTQPLIMAIVASPSGWLSDRIGNRILCIIGMLILAAGLFGMSTLGPETNKMLIIALMAISGLGIGIFISPNSSALMGSAPRKQQGTAGSVMAFARNFGMMCGVAIATTIYQMSGGSAKGQWQEIDYHALHIAFIAAACISILGAFTSAFRPGK